MNIELAQQLCELNNQFYCTWADSFSSTRHNTWPGWERCLQEAGLRDIGQKTATADGMASAEASNAASAPTTTCESAALKEFSIPSQPLPAARPLNVLDVACGNLRFEAFLAHSLPNRKIRTYALDACDELALDNIALPDNGEVAFHHCDAIAELRKGTLRETLCGSGPMDFTVSFGFMHHIPLPEWRTLFLNALLEATAPGGFTCVSLWRFLSDKGLAAKAKRTTAQGIAELGYDNAQLDEGDCLLGWRNEPGAYRYCHSFSENEIDALIESALGKARPAARFQADGRSGNLNEYLVLQRR